MLDNPLFSIIMPVYGVERYLSSSVESVLSQTFSDFELILVDDKSPDNCPKMCDDYQKNDSRVRVIHKPQNEGLGMARNTGFKEANGEFVLFMDSDDGIDKECLSKVKNSLKEDTEIVVFGLKKIHENKKGKVTAVIDCSCEAIEGNSVKDSGEIFLKLNDAHIFPFAWNKVYKKSFLADNKAEFEKTKLIEDFLFNIDLFSKAQKIIVLPDCFYNYRRPAHQTLVNTYSPEFYDLAKRKYSLELEFLQKTENDNPTARQKVIYSHIKHIISVFLRNRSKGANLTAKNQKAIIKNVLNDETTVSALEEYKPSGIVNKVISFLFKKKWVNACYYLIICISLLKRR